MPDLGGAIAMLLWLAAFAVILGVTLAVGAIASLFFVFSPMALVFVSFGIAIIGAQIIWMAMK